MGIPEPSCRICGVPILKSDLCPLCANSRPPYQALRSWLVFEGPIRLALHNLKYHRDMALGDALARQLALFVKNLHWQVDVVIPVPLGKKRQQERGYNQVGMVAMPLAGLLGWDYSPTSLARIRETRSQVGLSPAERKENVSGAFLGNPDKICGRTVLLVDDVTTTGATISACAAALLESGAREVYAVTLARALARHGMQIV